MISSQLSQQTQQNNQSFEDQNALQNLRQMVSLNNHQLLQLTYNDQKFYQKLKELNAQGCKCIRETQYPEALIYLNEAEKVLEYAASCGKTIERNLIITTLNNQACLYQKAWQLQKAQSYLQAIIYNISSFFQNNSQHQQQKTSHIMTKNILKQNSQQYDDFCVSLWRKKSMVGFYLQYTAVNSQSKNHQNAFKTAAKTVNLMKQICMDEFRYEKFKEQNIDSKLKNSKHHKKGLDNQKYALDWLASIRSLDLKDEEFDQFYKRTIKYIALYLKRMQQSQPYDNEVMEEYRKHLQHYTIGTLMQISPVELDQNVDKVCLEKEFSLVQKHLKAMCMSVGHFILGTQGRYIASQKYTLDENQRKSSTQYKQAQVYHLCSILVATKFLLCQSAYFDHIVNSFRNHYKIDILQDATKYLQQNKSLTEQCLVFEDSFFDKKQQSHTNIKQRVNQIQHIQQQESQIQTMKQIDHLRNQDINFGINTEESEELDDSPISPKQMESARTKSTKLSKNTGANNTATKKGHTKKISSNHLTKSQARLQTHQGNKLPMNSQYQAKGGNQKNINLLTSREKQNKQKITHANNANVVNVKSSRSKKKSEYQFFQSNKKIDVVNGVLPMGVRKQKYEPKQQLISHKRQSEYIAAVTSKSRTKSKRIPTSIDTERKIIRRKDSCGDLRKTKKVQEQYGICPNAKNSIPIQAEIKTSRNNLNKNTMKKSKNKQQSQFKQMNLRSTEIKLKKLTSPVKNQLK